MTEPLSRSIEIDERTLISRGDGLMVAPVGDETVMMEIASGRYFGLDDIGSEIWRRLEAPCTFGALVDGLTADYDADRTVIANDVRNLLSEMAAHNVVTLAQGARP
jgi:hypothetical protein